MVAISDAWIAVLAAGAVTQLLRYLPLLLLRGGERRMPAVCARILDGAGWATLGGLIALAVFRTAPEAATTEAAQAASFKLIALGTAFLFYLRTRQSMLSLGLGYAAYLGLVLMPAY